MKKLTESCFCPVFIFSNKGQEKIIEKLVEKKLYSIDKPNHIFVKSKSDVAGGTKLFREIEKWIKSNPSIYVFKEWEKEYRKSKNKLFVEFQNRIDNGQKSCGKILRKMVQISLLN